MLWIMRSAGISGFLWFFYGFLGSILLDIRQPLMSSFEKPPPPGMTMDWHRPRCFRRAEDVRPLMPLLMATQGAKAIVEGYTPGRIWEDSVARCGKQHLYLAWNVVTVCCLTCGNCETDSSVVGSETLQSRASHSTSSS